MTRFTSVRVLLAAALLLWAGGEARGDTFVVAPPFTIQNAVDLALANTSTTDAILVHPGTYPEAVLVDYTGSNQEALLIARAVSARPKITKGVLIRDSRLVTLSGFRVDSTHDDGVAAIRILDCTSVAVVDCQGTPGDDGGVSAINTFEVVVGESDFSGMKDDGGGGIGVEILDRCAHEVRNSTTSGNDKEGLVIEADRVLVRGCSSTGNGGGGVSIVGLRNEVRDCVVNENGGYGVHAVGVCIVKKSTISSNAGVGVRYGDGATSYHGGQITSNKIRHNGSHGVSLRDGQDGVLVKANSLVDNSGAGIRVAGDGCVILDNTCRDTVTSAADGHGIHLTDLAEGNCVEENSLRDNDGEGILVEGDENFLILNEAKGNDGIVKAVGALDNDGRGNTTVTGVNDFP
ncbi:MAG: right-handed parallel beta-helix repeat-containing protein [Planctomycetes bacterium]|nr:right-handed parallel beta-helix repeat-containing protein [Planctomycetota bacterium]